MTALQTELRRPGKDHVTFRGGLYVCITHDGYTATGETSRLAWANAVACRVYKQLMGIDNERMFRQAPPVDGHNTL